MVFWRRRSAEGASRRPVAELPNFVKRRPWLCAFLASLFVHAVAVPLGLPRLLIDASPDIEVAYLPDLPASPSDVPVSEREALDDKLKPEEKPPAPETPPEPEKPLEKPPEKKPEPLEVVPMPELPMVDQEEFPDETDNKNARFLAQKNHKVDEDVQAKERSLEKPPPADTPDAPQGDPNPPSAPTAPEQRVAKVVESPLRMREPGAELSEPRPVEADGESKPWRMVKPGATQGAYDRLPIAPSQLKPRDYDMLVGPGLAEAERRSAALADPTGRPSHWDQLMRKQDALRASLENFVGDVKVGNQQELGTRKHPFAAFITAMHRQIHRYWGDGFLDDLDRKGGNAYPQSLVVAVEITVKPDGAVAKTIFTKPSGSLPFDAAAQNAVLSAAPFPPPPEVIKSTDGQTRLTWYFHRDDRQCHPVYVNMHILNMPHVAKAPAGAKTPAAPPSLDPQRVRLQNPAPGPLPLIPGTKPGAAPPLFASRPSSSPSLAPAPTVSPNPPPAPAAPAPATPPKSTVPDGAREAAEQWLAAYQKSDVKRLAIASALPFTAGGKEVADSAPSLRAWFSEMLAEGVPKREGVTYYTQSQIRRKLGRLPRGADEDDMLFAWVDLSGEDLILLLSLSDRGWSVVGLDR